MPPSYRFSLTWLFCLVYVAATLISLHSTSPSPVYAPTTVHQFVPFISVPASPSIKRHFAIRPSHFHLPSASPSTERASTDLPTRPPNVERRALDAGRRATFCSSVPLSSAQFQPSIARLALTPPRAALPYSVFILLHLSSVQLCSVQFNRVTSKSMRRTSNAQGRTSNAILPLRAFQFGSGHSPASPCARRHSSLWLITPSPF